jgi:hypothetical protein
MLSRLLYTRLLYTGLIAVTEQSRGRTVTLKGFFFFFFFFFLMKKKKKKKKKKLFILRVNAVIRLLQMRIVTFFLSFVCFNILKASSEH